MAASKYRIVLRGWLSENFESAFDGMTVEHAPNRTVLTGDVRDQAQLYGLIGRLQEFGIELLAVEPADVADGGCEPDAGPVVSGLHEVTRGVTRPITRDGRRHRLMKNLFIRARMIEADGERDLVLTDGMIADADPVPETEPDAGWVLPGLVDVHNHLSLASPAGDHPDADVRVRASASVELALGVPAIREPGSHFAVMRERGIAWVPTLFPGGSHAACEFAAAMGFADETLAWMRALLDAQPATIMRADRVGVTVLAGTDAGQGPHGAIVDQIQMPPARPGVI